MKERLMDIVDAISVSGREKELLSLIEKKVTPSAKISYDVMGNLYIKKDGDGCKSILLAVSIDSEGFFVNYSFPEEKIRIAPTFSVTDYSTIVGSKLKGCGITGTVCSEKEKDITLSDIYFEPDEDQAAPNIGDHLSFVSSVNEEEGYLLGRRVGIACIISALIDCINNYDVHNTVTVVFAVCGIPGGRGLKTVWNTASPDKAIVLRTLESTKELPILLAKDGITLSDTEMFRKAADMLSSERIDHTLGAVTDTKRDAMSVNLSDIGIPTLSLALPTQNIGKDSEKVYSPAAEAISDTIKALIKINY
ncbi:MAG: hypothetical protein IKT70_02175 [Clostridia bacterium]|nr:hypothetical protein [Clostridia bacterium]